MVEQKNRVKKVFLKWPYLDQTLLIYDKQDRLLESFWAIDYIGKLTPT